MERQTTDPVPGWNPEDLSHAGAARAAEPGAKRPHPWDSDSGLRAIKAQRQATTALGPLSEQPSLGTPPYGRHSAPPTLEQDGLGVRPVPRTATRLMNMDPPTMYATPPSGVIMSRPIKDITPDDLNNTTAAAVVEAQANRRIFNDTPTMFGGPRSQLSRGNSGSSLSSWTPLATLEPRRLSGLAGHNRLSDFTSPNSAFGAASPMPGLLPLAAQIGAGAGAGAGPAELQHQFKEALPVPQPVPQPMPQPVPQPVPNYAPLDAASPVSSPDDVHNAPLYSVSDPSLGTNPFSAMPGQTQYSTSRMHVVAPPDNLGTHAVAASDIPRPSPLMLFGGSGEQPPSTEWNLNDSLNRGDGRGMWMQEPPLGGSGYSAILLDPDETGVPFFAFSPSSSTQTSPPDNTFGMGRRRTLDIPGTLPPDSDLFVDQQGNPIMDQIPVINISPPQDNGVERRAPHSAPRSLSTSCVYPTVQLNGRSSIRKKIEKLLKPEVPDDATAATVAEPPTLSSPSSRLFNSSTPVRPSSAAAAASSSGRATGGFGTPKVQARSKRDYPHSASKVDRLRKGAISKKPGGHQDKLPYDPFLSCTKHPHCVARSKLRMKEILAGNYYKYEPGEPKKDTDSAPKQKLAQALKTDGTPYSRVRHVEDNSAGVANMMQLHMIRALDHRHHNRRPLLVPAASASTTTNPVLRILTSKRFYSGRFFTNNGTCQTEDCCLVSFPKNHRGDVRLQMKVWNETVKTPARTPVKTPAKTPSKALAKTPSKPSKAAKAAKGRGSAASSTKKEDIKAHLLSYICWLYALSDQQPDLLGQWPTTLESSCEWGHKARSGDENDEFLCINPFHYLAKPGSDDKEDLRERIEDRCNTCIKDEPAIEGERDDQLGHCACFCPKCRDLRDT